MHLIAPCIDGGQRIGRGQISVVVTMDTQKGLRTEELLLRCLHDGCHLFGQATAVGVAHDDPFGSCVGCGANRIKSIGRIGSIAVKKVFGVVNHFGMFR